MSADAVKKLLLCPVCGCNMAVTDDGKSVKCDGLNIKNKKHSYDFSSDGYLSFGVVGGDSKEAVRARTAFLSQDFYMPVARDVKAAVDKFAEKKNVLVDAGCGEGYYTQMLSESFDYTVGFDLSKFACAAGAKRAKKASRDNLLYATASVFELPLQNGCADVVTNIFAPCAEDEYRRILRDGGLLFVVGAGKDHLMGLKKAIYDDVYENGQRADLPQNMEKVATVTSKHRILVNGKDNIVALFSMTPYYWRTSESDKEKLSALDSLETEIEFEINIYKKIN